MGKWGVGVESGWEKVGAIDEALFSGGPRKGGTGFGPIPRGSMRHTITASVQPLICDSVRCQVFVLAR